MAIGISDSATFITTVQYWQHMEVALNTSTIATVEHHRKTCHTCTIQCLNALLLPMHDLLVTPGRLLQLQDIPQLLVLGMATLRTTWLRNEGNRRVGTMHWTQYWTYLTLY